MTPTLLRVREKVIASVPEIRYLNYSTEHQCLRNRFRSIQLADVLRALPIGIYMKTMGDQLRLVFENRDGSELEWWDLTKLLDEQSPETIAFLDSILNTTV